MGNRFQKLADIDAAPDEAQRLAIAIMEWLIKSEVVAPAGTGCVLGDGPGHAPGLRYAEAVVVPDHALLRLKTNGVNAVTGRTVFHNGQSGVERISCPHCGVVADWDDVADTIGTWYEGGHGSRPCVGCQRRVGLNDWRWEPPWGFGHLGFTFWNWPQLRPEFVAEVSARLGHRVIWIADKL
jgi:hypothetical protein